MNKKQKQLTDAIIEIYDALCGYCEDCISSDKKAQARIDKAWSRITAFIITDMNYGEERLSPKNVLT